jgi:hypothetical protein
MKKFLAILILIFTLPTSSQADDIRDFQIEGISLGDSLLDYLSEEKIKSLRKEYYPKSKKYYRLYNFKKGNELTTYDFLDVHVKENDKKYIVESVNGVMDYKNNIHECYAKKREIAEEISSILGKLKKESYVYNYPNDKGKSDITDFIYSNGAIRIWCTDYSEKREKDNWDDHLSVTVSSMKFLNWLNTAQ